MATFDAVLELQRWEKLFIQVRSRPHWAFRVIEKISVLKFVSLFSCCVESAPNVIWSRPHCPFLSHPQHLFAIAYRTSVIVVLLVFTVQYRLLSYGVPPPVTSDLVLCLVLPDWLLTRANIHQTMRNSSENKRRILFCTKDKKVIKFVRLALSITHSVQLMTFQTSLFSSLN